MTSKRKENLLAKEARIKAQLKQVNSAERELNKKRETRRKVLIGAAFLAKVDRGEIPEEKLLLMMNKFLIRHDERALFGLTPLDENAADSSATSEAHSNPIALTTPTEKETGDETTSMEPEAEEKQ
jgi:hypothetical protein